MKSVDRCTPDECLALDLERLSAELNRIRERHRFELRGDRDVRLSDLNGELLAFAGELGPEVVLPETREAFEFSRSARK